MNERYFLISLAALSLSVAVTRFAPFLLLGGKGEVPAGLKRLGEVLPGAVMGLLVVYCLKDLEFTELSGWLPAVISAAVTGTVHYVKGNTALSICLGTGLYMALIRLM